MKQRITDLTLSVVACIAAFFLSWPFWRRFEYAPESHLAWYIYFVLGFVLSVYIFFLFIGSLRILFLHDAQGREAAAAPPTAADQQPAAPNEGKSVQ